MEGQNSARTKKKVPPSTYHTLAATKDNVTMALPMSNTDAEVLKKMFEGGFFFIIGCNKRYEPIITFHIDGDVNLDLDPDEELVVKMNKTAQAFHHFKDEMTDELSYHFELGLIDGIHILSSDYEEDSFAAYTQIPRLF